MRNRRHEAKRALRQVVRRNLLPALVAATVLLTWSPAGATPPALSSVQPTHGQAQSLVLVTGTGLEGSRLVWDAGLPSEAKLAGTIQGTTMISVPAGSATGNHPIALESTDGRSAVATFVVDGGTPNSTPRLDEVTLANSKFGSDGTVTVNLYVQGANLDVGSKVLVDGVETPSNAHKAIYNNLFGANPSVLGYPIRHYLSRIVSEVTRKLGTSVMVKLVNENGESSNGITYQLPSDPKTFSSAGDGIADDAKLNGYDNGHGRIDLRALGADPYRKIVFVQIDVMARAIAPIKSTPARPGTFDTVRQMFANAPLINPYGTNGIDLVIDASGTAPNWLYLDFIDDDRPKTGEGSFWRLRSSRLDQRRVGLYHYAVWGRERLDGASGFSDVDFDGTKVGDAFMITMGDADQVFQTVQSQAETFAHELGHDLGQRHGGTNHHTHKPNYWSLMAYTWQLRSSRDDADRRKYPTCTQIYYATPGALEANGKLPSARQIRLDYSEGMGPTLIGSALNEAIGVCGQPIDWNRNGKIDKMPVSVVVDDEDVIDARVDDMANWPNLRFDGPKLGGSHNP